MYNKSISILVITAFLLMSVTTAFGKPRGTWKDVTNLVGQEIVVKINTRRSKIYGVLKAADDKGIKIQIAGKKSMSPDEISLKREQIKKVWRALLFVGRRKTAKGAIIGAAAGGAILGGVAASTADSGETGEDGPFTVVAIVIGAGLGAGLGALAGFFIKSPHKKRDLIYKP